MTRGRELPVNSKVRRRLFQEDQEPYPEWNSHDHLSKVIKTEYIARTLNNQLILKGMKWNFDFQSERSLRGCLQWYRKGNSNDWVMMEPTGKSIYMRKRSREPLSGLKFTYEEERRGAKKRRLSSHTVAMRRGFFTDGRVFNMALSQAEDENFTNEFNDDPPPEYSRVRGFDRPPWDTEEETEDDEEYDENQSHERPQELNTEEKLDNEVLQNKNENKEEEIKTDEHRLEENIQIELAQTVDMEKDANDNQEPTITEDKFEKLHINDVNKNMEETYADEQIEMKNLNEATPKNKKKMANAKQKKGKAKTRAKNGKAKKKLHTRY